MINPTVLNSNMLKVLFRREIRDERKEDQMLACFGFRYYEQPRESIENREISSNLHLDSCRGRS